MGTFIGIDGIRGGWVAVYADEKGAQRFVHSPRLDRLLAVSHSRAMIDVPIGLPERGYRQCDREARKLVGPSVFLGAPSSEFSLSAQAPIISIAGSKNWRDLAIHAASTSAVGPRRS
jgi:predicted RNase H-like nuclease